MFCGFESNDPFEEIYNNEEESDDNNEETDRAEMEAALYAQIHYESEVPVFQDENGNENTSINKYDNHIQQNYHTSVHVDSKPVSRSYDIDKVKVPLTNQNENKLYEVPLKETVFSKEIVKGVHECDGLSAEKAISLSDSESDVSKLKRPDYISISSGSDSDAISISSDTSDTSDSSEEEISESMRLWSRSQLCNDMMLDEVVVDPIDVIYNINQGQHTLVKQILVDSNSINSDDDKWMISDKDKLAANPRLSRYYNPITVRCHNCNELGHISNACPKPKKLDICHLCGEIGHFFRNCPMGICYNCDAPASHRSKDCPKPRKYTNMECHRCLMYGHGKYECPDIWRQYHMTTSNGKIEKRKRRENPKTHCYNCASHKHFGYECRRKRMDKYSFPQYPFIATYIDNIPSDKRRRDEDDLDGPPKKKQKDAKETETSQKMSTTVNKSEPDKNSKKKKKFKNVDSQTKKKKKFKNAESETKKNPKNTAAKTEKKKRDCKSNVESPMNEKKCKGTKSSSERVNQKKKNKGTTNKNRKDNTTFSSGGKSFENLSITIANNDNFPRTKQKPKEKQRQAIDNPLDLEHQAYNNQWWEGSPGSGKRKRTKKKKNSKKNKETPAPNTYSDNKSFVSKRGFVRKC